jgi:hypothetical protein
MMIDGCAFTEALSVPANKPLLDVTGATTFSSTGGVITMFNPHYHATGITIKGAKNFYNVSFGNNITLANFACRNTSDFILSDTDKPIFNIVRVAYLPHPSRQNKVIFNNVTITSNLEMTYGVVTGAGRLKIGGNLLIGADGKIEMDVECNGTWQQNIGTYLSNTSALIKGNVYVNNPDRVSLGMDLEIQNGTLQLVKGKFDLNEKTLTLNRAPIGGSATSYVLSINWAQKAGLLFIKNLTGNTIFPVGTSNSYVPVALKGTGDFSVAVKPLLDNNPLGINVQWIINRVKGTAPADIQVQWNAQNEGSSFKNLRPNCQLKRFENNNWVVVGGYGAVSQPNGLIFTKTILNVTSFSTFTLQSTLAAHLTGNEVEKSSPSDELRENPLGFVNPTDDTPKKRDISIFPNPISSESFLNLYLNVDNQEDTQIMIFNTNQQLVYQNRFYSKEDLKIPVANLLNGLYSIQILNGGQLFYQKFVKNALN